MLINGEVLHPFKWGPARRNGSGGGEAPHDPPPTAPPHTALGPEAPRSGGGGRGEKKLVRMWRPFIPF